MIYLSTPYFNFLARTQYLCTKCFLRALSCFPHQDSSRMNQVTWDVCWDFSFFFYVTFLFCNGKQAHITALCHSRMLFNVCINHQPWCYFGSARSVQSTIDLSNGGSGRTVVLVYMQWMTHDHCGHNWYFVLIFFSVIIFFYKQTQQSERKMVTHYLDSLLFCNFQFISKLMMKI